MLSINHIHIGKNDVIGNQFEKMGIKTYSHDELDKIDWSNNVNFSISAFNPENKSLDQGEFSFELKLLERINPCSNLVYFSTARPASESIKYNNYVNHKTVVEKYFLNNVDNVLVLRVPNIVDVDLNFTSRFVKAFRAGLSCRSLRFDCAPENEWNFVTNKSLVSFVNNLFASGVNLDCGTYYFYSTEWTSAEDLSDLCIKNGLIDRVEYGVKKFPFPKGCGVDTFLVDVDVQEVFRALCGIKK